MKKRKNLYAGAVYLLLTFLNGVCVGEEKRINQSN